MFGLFKKKDIREQLVQRAKEVKPYVEYMATTNPYFDRIPTKADKATEKWFRFCKWVESNSHELSLLMMTYEFNFNNEYVDLGEDVYYPSLHLLVRARLQAKPKGDLSFSLDPDGMFLMSWTHTLNKLKELISFMETATPRMTIDRAQYLIEHEDE